MSSRGDNIPEKEGVVWGRAGCVLTLVPCHPPTVAQFPGPPPHDQKLQPDPLERLYDSTRLQRKLFLYRYHCSPQLVLGPT